MSSGAKLASECFAENLQDYINQQTDGEKHNLYTGLKAMAKSLDDLNQHVRSVDDKLSLVIQKLASLR